MLFSLVQIWDLLRVLLKSFCSLIFSVALLLTFFTYIFLEFKWCKTQPKSLHQNHIEEYFRILNLFSVFASLTVALNSPPPNKQNGVMLTHDPLQGFPRVMFFSQSLLKYAIHIPQLLLLHRFLGGLFSFKSFPLFMLIHLDPVLIATSMPFATKCYLFLPQAAFRTVE